MTEKERIELAELLFPNITKTREEYERCQDFKWYLWQ